MSLSRESKRHPETHNELLDARNYYFDFKKAVENLSGTDYTFFSRSLFGIMAIVRYYDSLEERTSVLFSEDMTKISGNSFFLKGKSREVVESVLTIDLQSEKEEPFWRLIFDVNSKCPDGEASPLPDGVFDFLKTVYDEGKNDGFFQELLRIGEGRELHLENEEDDDEEGEEEEEEEGEKGEGGEANDEVLEKRKTRICNDWKMTVVTMKLYSSSSRDDYADYYLWKEHYGIELYKYKKTLKEKVPLIPAPILAHFVSYADLDSLFRTSTKTSTEKIVISK